MNPYEIVRRPRISEKTMYLQNKMSAYISPHQLLQHRNR